MRRLAYWVVSWWESLRLHWFESELEAEIYRRAKGITTEDDA